MERRMKRSIVLLAIMLCLLGFAWVAQARQEKALEEAQQKELAAWRQTVEQAQAEYNKALAELEEMPAYRRYQLAEAKLNAAMNGLAAVIKGTCGEVGIKPSECEISPDGKRARRKEAKQR